MSRSVSLDNALFLGLAAAVAAGCASQPNKESMARQDPTTRCIMGTPRPQVELRFDSYTDAKHTENVLYYLDEKLLGKGQDGFEALLGELRTLTPGTIVRVSHKANEPDLFPFHARAQEFVRVLRQQELLLLK